MVCTRKRKRHMHTHQPQQIFSHGMAAGNAQLLEQLGDLEQTDLETCHGLRRQPPMAFQVSRHGAGGSSGPGPGPAPVYSTLMPLALIAFAHPPCRATVRARRVSLKTVGMRYLV